MVEAPCTIRLPPYTNILLWIFPLIRARWIVQTAEAVPSDMRNVPVRRSRLEGIAPRLSEIQVRMPTKMTKTLAKTFVIFQKERAGRRIWIAGNDAAITRPAARVFTSASSIEIVFISIPPYSIF
jgi:hypothetical protein